MQWLDKLASVIGVIARLKDIVRNSFEDAAKEYIKAVPNLPEDVLRDKELIRRHLLKEVKIVKRYSRDGVVKIFRISGEDERR